MFLVGCSQEPQWRYLPVVDTIHLALGDTTATLVRRQYGDSSTPFLLHIHHNEASADSAQHDYLSKEGGRSLGFLNGRERLVSFPFGGKRYLFDPNRMFTDEGARQSLKLLSSSDSAALQAVRQFADSVLQFLPADGPVVALHNNTNGSYSLLSYRPGGEHKTETADLYRNPQMDPDNFVLTTDAKVFRQLRTSGLNAVLQHNMAAANDGSLGYVFGKKRRVYINVEAQHGHSQEQLRLLEQVIKAIKPE